MGKQEKIVSMFNDIAGTYDVANRVMSMGIDKTWRNKACNLAFSFYGKNKIEKIIDVACGTGDMLTTWQKVADKNAIEIQNRVGVDPSVGMMDVAKVKLPEVEFIEAGAELLPFDSEVADIVSISYGIRNVVQRQEAFDEFARVLKKDGLVVISEFTKNRLLEKYHFKYLADVVVKGKSNSIKLDQIEEQNGINYAVISIDTIVDSKVVFTVLKTDRHHIKTSLITKAVKMKAECRYQQLETTGAKFKFHLLGQV